MTEGRGSRVLLVDDDPDMIGLLRLKLEPLGYVVQEAASGEEALRLIDKECPDVVVLDVAMPVMSGIEVLKRVRSLGLNVPIIVMTAFGSESIAEDALNHGADSYVAKPFELKEFTRIVGAAIERRESVS